jgi:hypothetical protein
MDMVSPGSDVARPLGGSRAPRPAVAATSVGRPNRRSTTPIGDFRYGAPSATGTVANLKKYLKSDPQAIDDNIQVSHDIDAATD